MVIARNCDWFMALFLLLVISGSNCFGFWFFDCHLKTAPLDEKLSLSAAITVNSHLKTVLCKGPTILRGVVGILIT